MMHAQPPGTGKKVQDALGSVQLPPHEPMPPIAWHGPRTQPHAPVTGSATHTSVSDSHSPPQVPPAWRPQGGGKTVLVVEVDVVVVVVALQPPASQASQQLGTAPTHALPPFGGATQRAAVRLSAQEVVPERRVRQHVTKPGLPQVDLEAQRLTTPAQPLFASTAAPLSTAQRT
jgi:hypothetical protein